DVIERGSRLFDKLIVAMAINIEKLPLFSVEEREEMLRATMQERGIDNVEVEHFDGMIVDFVKSQGSRVLLRGIRSLSDFESEFQMALTNRELARDVETVFVMASLEYSFVSSRLIREVAALGGDVSRFVPPVAEAKLKQRFQR
ncbi:MAG: pantetheine-phosphate adenylyltransferase, partial [Planctomycetes bacterium]|nr:pantetheine-phosphate adenylyltransferase [Planctomycetota bacterium]